MDRDTAKTAVLEYLATYLASGKEITIIDEYTVETPRSWVFFWDSKKWVVEGISKHRLLGNVPILVDKASGAIHKVPWGGTIVERIARVERTINPTSNE